MGIQLAVGNVVEVRLTALLFGQVCINTFHYLIGAGTPADTDMEDLLQVFGEDVWNGQLSNVLSQDYQDVIAQGQVISPVRGLVLNHPLDPTQGSVGTAAAPPTVAVSIRRRTAVAGRSKRGRVFIAGIPVASTSQGRIATGEREGWDDAATGIDQELTFGSRTATPIIWSIKDATNRGTVVTVDVDYILRSQRRREIGKGI